MHRSRLRSWALLLGVALALAGAAALAYATPLFEAAARLVKPGGRLVYATCSILEEENEQVVQGFAAENEPFRALDCGEILKGQRIGLDSAAYLRLWPHVHGTDGFFAAAFERR